MPRSTLAVLVLLITAAYAPSLGNGYAFDDALLASPTLPDGTDNGMTAELRPLSDYFRHGYWHGHAGEASPLYRPLPILTFAVNNALRAGAFGHHLLNLLLHAATVVLAFALARRVGAGTGVALLAATLFGANAIHSEVVAGVVGRAELLAFTFGAVATLTFAGTPPRARSPRLLLQLGSSSLCFLLALLSKESAAAWIPVALLVALLRAEPGGDGPPRVRLRRHLVRLAAVAAPPVLVFSLLRHAAVGGASAPITFLANPLAHVDVATRVRTGLMLWGFGLGQCAWPFSPLSDYGPATFAPVTTIADPRLLAALGALGAGLAAACAAPRRRPLLVAAAALFVAFSFPISNVPFAIGTVYGERLYFTPSLGVALAAAWLVARVPPRWPRRVAGAGVALWLASSLLVVVGRNAAWANDEALVLADADSNPRSIRLLDAKASWLRGRGEAAAAERIWRDVLSLDPDAVEALTNLGTLLAESGRSAEAEALFRRALAVPDYRRPLRHVTQLNLCALYERAGRTDDVRAALRAAWREDLAYVEPFAALLAPTAAWLPADEVLAIAAEGERRNPGRPEWQLLRGYVAHGRGDHASARREFEGVLAARPRDAAARLALALTHLAAGERAAAVPLLEALGADASVPEPIRARAASLLRSR